MSPTRSGTASQLTPGQLGVPGGATPRRRLLVAEASNALQRRHLAITVLLVAMGLLLAAWLPLWPETVYRFFVRVFRLDGWSDVILVNYYTGLIYCLYWLGVVDVLRVYVQPFEEQYLDLLLSKPIARRDYLLARLTPTLVLLLTIGAVASAALAAAMLVLGLPLDLAAYSGTVAILLAYIVCLVALANLLLVGTRDSFTALVVAFVPFMAVLLPSVAFIYRPDVFEAAPIVMHLLVFPINLLWHDRFVIQWGLLVALALLLTTMAAVVLAGRRLNRLDVS